MSRPLCKKCGKNPRAINCHLNGRVYYRSVCESCLKNKKVFKPRWQGAGYKKKPHCEKCGFKSRFTDQLFVYFRDGDMNNIDSTNLKTVCSNCQIELSVDPKGWRLGDLQIDQ